MSHAAFSFLLLNVMTQIILLYLTVYQQ